MPLARLTLIDLRCLWCYTNPQRPTMIVRQQNAKLLSYSSLLLWPHQLLKALLNQPDVSEFAIVAISPPRNWNIDKTCKRVYKGRNKSYKNPFFQKPIHPLRCHHIESFVKSLHRWVAHLRRHRRKKTCQPSSAWQWSPCMESILWEENSLRKKLDERWEIG